MLATQRKSKFALDDLLIVCIFLFPILRYYDLPLIGVGFETFLTVFIFVLCLLINLVPQQRTGIRELQKSKNWYVFFVIWLFIVTLFYEAFTDINAKAPNANYNYNAIIFPFIRAICICILLWGGVKTDKCISIYSKFIWFIAIIYIFQWILYFAGIKISFRLPFEATAGWAHIDTYPYFGMIPYPRVLFSERSHLCEYIIPYIAICLFSKNLIQKNRLRKAIFLTIILISTVSGNGIVTAFLMWFLYFIFFAKFKDRSTKFLISLIGITVLLLIYLLLSNIPTFSAMFETLFSSEEGSPVTSKADYRIYRGFDLFSKMPSWSQFIGVGFKHMYLFADKYNIVSEFDSKYSAYEYFSGITMVLIYSGGIGMFAYFQSFWSLYKSKINAVKGLIIVFFALSLSTEILFNGTNVMYIILIVAVLEQEKKLASIQRSEKA